MLRDRLVVSIQDKRMSLQLQLNPELTLERATDMIFSMVVYINKTCMLVKYKTFY